MKTIYFDCAMGAAGDMLTAALLELHPDPEGVLRRLNGLGLPGVEVSAVPSVKCGITGTHVSVKVHGEEEESMDVSHDHDHGHDHGHVHHYDQDGVCSCGHHHGHDADQVFTSWGMETIRAYDPEDLSHMLAALDGGAYGQVLRAKGIVAGKDGQWLHFDYVPGEAQVRKGTPGVTGRLCVIGAQLQEEALASLFEVA